MRAETYSFLNLKKNIDEVKITEEELFSTLLGPTHTQELANSLRSDKEIEEVQYGKYAYKVTFCHKEKKVKERK